MCSSSMLEPPTKRFKASDVNCLRCKAAPVKGAEDWAFYSEGGKPFGTACKRCWRGFSAGWSDKNSWDDFCDACDEDPPLARSFDIGLAILSGEMGAPFGVHDVENSSEYSVDVVRRLVGIPRATFQTMTGMTPGDAGITESELPNEAGAKYKGVLMLDPRVPFLEYSIRHSLKLSKSNVLVDHRSQVFESQAETAFQDARSSRDSEPFFTKLRNCTLSAETVDEKIGKQIFEQMKPQCKERMATGAEPNDAKKETSSSL